MDRHNSPPLSDATVDSAPPPRLPLEQIAVGSQLLVALGDILGGWVVVVVDLKPLCPDSRDVLGVVSCEEDIATNLLVAGDGGTWGRLGGRGSIAPKTRRMSLRDNLDLVLSGDQFNAGEFGMAEKHRRIFGAPLGLSPRTNSHQTIYPLVRYVVGVLLLHFTRWAEEFDEDRACCALP
jgi:hypothetical protein